MDRTYVSYNWTYWAERDCYCKVGRFVFKRFVRRKCNWNVILRFDTNFRASCFAHCWKLYLIIGWLICEIFYWGNMNCLVIVELIDQYSILYLRLNKAFINAWCFCSVQLSALLKFLPDNSFIDEISRSKVNSICVTYNDFLLQTN